MAKRYVNTGDLFDDPIINHEPSSVPKDWGPAEPFSLANVDEPIIDFETTGVKWWRGDRPIGASITLPDGRSQYLAWGHCEGNNISEDSAKEFFRREVRNKRVLNQSTKFEVHMAREWGVDLEEQGCTVGDVSYNAALLDDFRKVFNLNQLVIDFCPGLAGKVELINGAPIDKSRMRDYHGGTMAPYACRDGILVRAVNDAQTPRLVEQSLQRVRELEDEATFATCEMERNGALIDIPKLHRWVREAETEKNGLLLEIHRETGVKLEPGRDKTWLQLFEKLRVPITEDDGRPSFTDEVVFDATASHPTIKKAYRVAKLDDLLTKYLWKYQRTVGPDGILRYALHQLKSDEGGTITGRYSSSAIHREDNEGANIQQVSAVDKQIEKYQSDDFIIRELFIADTDACPEAEVLAADAMQIEYRIFADKANSKRVLDAYAADPLLSFHKLIWSYMLALNPDLGYKALKNLNFAKIYGAGLAKLALMMGFITKAQFNQLQREFTDQGRWVPREHPWLRKALEVERIYAQELPEGPALIKLASQLAAERGFVKTITGRRIRFKKKTITLHNGLAKVVVDRAHKALNGVIQGSAADVNKQKLVEVRRARKYLPFKLRMTVHDELVGDKLAKECVPMMQSLLDRQSFNLKVPILWDVKTGPNWAAA